MSAIEVKAADVRPPVKRTRTATDTGVRYFTVGTTHLTDEMPGGWHGQYVSFLSDVDFWFIIGSFGPNSVDTDIEVDRAVAAAAEPVANAKLGLKILANTMVHFRMPDRTEGQVNKDTGAPTEKLWFSRESGVAGNIYTWLSSGK